MSGPAVPPFRNVDTLHIRASVSRLETEEERAACSDLLALCDELEAYRELADVDLLEEVFRLRAILAAVVSAGKVTGVVADLKIRNGRLVRFAVCAPTTASEIAIGNVVAESFRSNGFDVTFEGITGSAAPVEEPK